MSEDLIVIFSQSTIGFCIIIFIMLLFTNTYKDISKEETNEQQYSENNYTGSNNEQGYKTD